ncbi:MAG: hypothetical protein OQK04_02810, partial [Kangiellaceae bacterium]|nr:hypothetical protein [Kangiellaceae bacterium]
MQQNQTASPQREKESKKESSSDNTWLAFASFLGGVIFLLILYFTGVVGLVSEQFNAVSKSDERLITFYQWTSASGEIIISRSKPNLNIDYITFEGSADL